MSASDISRSATDFRKHYQSVRMQMGRPLTDDDFNECARLVGEDMRRSRLHIIGPAGSSDDGLCISNPRLTLTDTDRALDFDIGAGTFHLGGMRLEIEDAESYRKQRDWLQPPAIPLPAAQTGERFDLVYVEAFSQAVRPEEDHELFEVALGVDTSTRIRTMRRVRVKPGVASRACLQAWESVLSEWENGKLWGEECERVPAVKLKVGFSADGTSDDLCSPPVVGGYLGAENQTIRVQLVDEDHFTWGYDNAAPLYRVRSVQPDGNQRHLVTLADEPRDQAHWPRAGQVVELLQSACSLPNDQQLAEISGSLAKVTASYDPDSRTLTVESPDPAVSPASRWTYLRVWDRGADTNSDPAISFTSGAETKLAGTGLTVTITGEECLAGDHWVIAVRPASPQTVVPWDFTAGEGRRPHGYRRFCAPLAVIRWYHDENGLQGKVISDCRRPFRPLTEVGTGACCTFRVGDGFTTHGDFDSIQEAIDHLPDEGGKICLLSGTHRGWVRIIGRRDIILTGNGEASRLEPGRSPAPHGEDAALWVTASSNIRIESLSLESRTGFGVLIGGDPPGAAPEGQVAAGRGTGAVVHGAARDVAVGRRPPVASGGASASYAYRGAPAAEPHEVTATEAPASNTPRAVVLSRLHVVAQAAPAICVRNGVWITIQDCLVEMRNGAGGWPTIGIASASMVQVERNVVGLLTAPESSRAKTASRQIAALGGVQLGGKCYNVHMAGNLIRGGIGNGITLGSLVATKVEGGSDDPTIMTRGAVDPCAHREPGSSEIGGSEPAWVSAGLLGDLHIVHNRIEKMGLNGIGVAGFFTEAKESIIVQGLTIEGNEIMGCLSRPLAAISATKTNRIGYGGIALADVTRLVVRANVIEDNGRSHVGPVCGLFLLHGAGVEISWNRIANNGMRAADSAAGASIGPRAGIWIVSATATEIPPPGGETEDSGAAVAPALAIHNNVVSTPLGRALCAAVLGPASVQANYFMTQGPDQSIVTSGFHATVWVRGVRAGGKADRMAASSQANLLFCGNQCTLSAPPNESGTMATSIGIMWMNDIVFQANQCDCDGGGASMFFHVVLHGKWVRTSDNRFNEPKGPSTFSAVTYGSEMNSATDNHAVHCVLTLRAPGTPQVVNRDNVVTAAYNSARCQRIESELSKRIELELSRRRSEPPK